MNSDMARTIAETKRGDQTRAEIYDAQGCFILSQRRMALSGWLAWR
ncbi:MAG: hypothetical protein ACU0B9_17595 [Limimaricola soesokkakensis]